jgi:hypothetical protein
MTRLSAEGPSSATNRRESRSTGKARRISRIRSTSPAIHLGPSEERKPRNRASTRDRRIAPSPMSREVRVPWTIRLYRSRPMLSVPSQWSPDGPARVFPRSTAVGECVAMADGRTAATRMRAATTAARMTDTGTRTRPLLRRVGRVGRFSAVGAVVVAVLISPPF